MACAQSEGDGLPETFACAGTRRSGPAGGRGGNAAPELAAKEVVVLHQLSRTGTERAMAGFRCVKCGKVAMAQKVCCGRPMKKA